MPDAKISGLTAKATPDPADLLVIVDVADLSMAPSGTDKRTTVGGLMLAQSQVAGLPAALAPLGPGGTAGRVPYWGAGPVLADSAGLTYDGTSLTVDCTAGAQYYEGAHVRGHGASLHLHDTDGTRDPIRLSNAFGQLFIFNDTTSTALAACTSGGHWAFGPAGALTSVTVLVSPPSASTYGLAIQGAASQAAPLLPLRGIASAGAAVDLGYLDAGFSLATDATYTGWVSLSSTDHNGTAHQGVRVDSDGTRALLGFYGAAPVAKAAAPATLADVIAILRNLGLSS